MAHLGIYQKNGKHTRIRRLECFSDAFAVSSAYIGIYSQRSIWAQLKLFNQRKGNGYPMLMPSGEAQSACMHYEQPQQVLLLS